MNNRGQITGATMIANFLLSILVGAIMTWIITEVTTPLLNRMENSTASSDTVGTTMNQWWADILGNQPILFLLISFFSLIALSVFTGALSR